MRYIRKLSYLIWDMRKISIECIHQYFGFIWDDKNLVMYVKNSKVKLYHPFYNISITFFTVKLGQSCRVFIMIPIFRKKKFSIATWPMFIALGTYCCFYIHVILRSWWCSCYNPLCCIICICFLFNMLFCCTKSPRSHFT